MRLEGKVEKTWGYEDIKITNDFYCLKYLHFTNKGGKTSMHFHKEKHETWLVTAGSFVVRYIQTVNGNISDHTLNVGDTWTNAPLEPHQLEALEDNSTILETSTPDSVEDNYRLYRENTRTSQEEFVGLPSRFRRVGL